MTPDREAPMFLLPFLTLSFEQPPKHSSAFLRGMASVLEVGPCSLGPQPLPRGRTVDELEEETWTDVGNDLAWALGER